MDASERNPINLFISKRIYWRDDPRSYPKLNRDRGHREQYSLQQSLLLGLELVPFFSQKKLLCTTAKF